MGIIRNFINIEGITPEEDLKNNNGHIIIYSDVENIFIPKSKPNVKSIYEITIDIDINSQRSINTPIGKLIVLDCTKKFKILYTENTELDNASVLNLEVPFNTFTELPKVIDNIYDVNIHVIDAYFSLLTPRTIYSHFLYEIEVNYDNSYAKKSIYNNNISQNQHNSYINIDGADKIIEEISISKENKNTETSLIDIDEEIL